MKQRLFLVVALCAFLFSSCMKEGDFSELNHPIQLQGDFDPTLGLPVAKMSADMNAFLGMLNSNDDVSVSVDAETDLVSFRYHDTISYEYSYTSKGCRAHNGQSKGAYGDSIVLEHKLMEGSTEIDLFKKLTELGNGNIEAKGLYVSLVANMHTAVSDNVRALMDHGVEVFFDCDTIYVTCMDGSEWTIGLGRSLGRINVRELVDGKRIPIVEEYDVSYLANRKPTNIRYTASFYVIAPPDINYLSVAQYISDTLCIDKLHNDMSIDINFPLQLYCRDLVYTDTIQIDDNQLGSWLEQIDPYVTLNDTNNKLVFYAENTLPFSVSLNAVCLDSNKQVISERLIARDSLLAGAPIKPYGSTGSYTSNGSSKSRIAINITRDNLDKLSRTRYLLVCIGGNSSTEGASESNPTIVVLGKDQLDLKLYLQVSPHIHLDTTL